MKDPLYKDSYLGITPPTFILPFEAPDFGISEIATDVRAQEGLRICPYCSLHPSMLLLAAAGSPSLGKHAESL